MIASLQIKPKPFMLHKSRNKSFMCQINAFKLGFFLTKTEEITSLTP